MDGDVLIALGYDQFLVPEAKADNLRCLLTAYKVRSYGKRQYARLKGNVELRLVPKIDVQPVIDNRQGKFPEYDAIIEIIRSSIPRNWVNTLVFDNDRAYIGENSVKYINVADPDVNVEEHLAELRECML